MKLRWYKNGEDAPPVLQYWQPNPPASQSAGIDYDECGEWLDVPTVVAPRRMGSFSDLLFEDGKTVGEKRCLAAAAGQRVEILLHRGEADVWLAGTANADGSVNTDEIVSRDRLSASGRAIVSDSGNYIWPDEIAEWRPLVRAAEEEAVSQQEREAVFAEWLEGRPEIIQGLAAQFKPWNVYRLKTTGQHCYPVAYNEDGTMRVQICGHDDEFIAAINELAPFQVFGIEPESLEPLAPLNA